MVAIGEGFGALIRGRGGGGAGKPQASPAKFEPTTDVLHFHWKVKEKCFCKAEIGGAGAAETQQAGEASGFASDSQLHPSCAGDLRRLTHPL